MADRSALADTFLSKSAWADASRAALAGDASHRRYERLTHPTLGRGAVFMDDPPTDVDNGVGRFAVLSNHLRALGFSAPEIYDQNGENGFLLLEDLGDDLFARVIATDPAQERPLYAAATDFLVTLHQSPPPAVVSPLGARLMAEMTGIVIREYRAAILGDDDPKLLRRFVNRFEDLLRQTIHGGPVLVMRDFHAENLIWLPDRAGVAKVGVLDFQDARCGHPAYDLVSLLQDARRDVPAGIEMAMINRYIDATGTDEHAFHTAYTVLGVQRNLRILGVFARLASQRGKPGYIDLIPRVWLHIRRALEQPAMAPMAAMILENIPLPTEENLQRLRDA
ncbi:MAG: aminoglycoside phosphotransferase family protein [Paracoccaceae bacterium]